jgi:hypothetical protein
MMDIHLSEMYSLEIRRINEQVNRNIERFPKIFMFQLTIEEFDSLTTEVLNKLKQIL